MSICSIEATFRHAYLRRGSWQTGFPDRSIEQNVCNRRISKLAVPCANSRFVNSPLITRKSPQTVQSIDDQWGALKVEPLHQLSDCVFPPAQKVATSFSSSSRTSTATGQSSDSGPMHDTVMSPAAATSGASSAIAASILFITSHWCPEQKAKCPLLAEFRPTSKDSTGPCADFALGTPDLDTPVFAHSG